MRVLHCPVEIAGQMWEYAQGLRALGVKATALTFYPHSFGYPHDVCLHVPLKPRTRREKWKLRKNLLNVILRYNVIHFHFGCTLLPNYRDLPLLRKLGKKMVMSYWGSEVRLPTLAKANNPYFTLIGDYGGREEVISQRLKEVAHYIKVVAVGDYELYSYVAPFFKEVIIIPSAIDTRRLQPVFFYPNKRVPLVMHIPSNKAIKGTSYILKAVKRLKSRYRFEFLLLQQMGNQEIREVLKKADIVVDQLLLGTHGIASLEAMALGKPVLCYIRDDLINKYPADFPIVNANPETIETELQKLLVSPQLRIEIGKRSRAYVEKHHDSRAVAEQLIKVYKSL